MNPKILAILILKSMLAETKPTSHQSSSSKGNNTNVLYAPYSMAHNIILPKRQGATITMLREATDVQPPM